MPDDNKNDAQNPDNQNMDQQKPDNQTKQQKQQDQTYDLTVDGTKRTVTLDEMKDLAQKSAGADRKFQDASDLRKNAEAGLRIQTLVKSLTEDENTPSDTEVGELATLLGLDPQEFTQYLAKEEDDSSTDTKQKKQADSGLSKEALGAALKELGLDPAEVRGVLDYSHQRHIESARKEIRKISDEAVDKDEIFGKIIVGEKAEDRLAVIKEMVAEDVLRRIQDGVPFGADLVASSVQKIRAHLTKFGIPGKPVEYPVTLGLGPGSGLPAEVQTDDAIKRVSAAEDGDEKNVVARYMQKGLQMLREKKKS